MLAHSPFRRFWSRIGMPYLISLLSRITHAPVYMNSLYVASVSSPFFLYYIISPSSLCFDFSCYFLQSSEVELCLKTGPYSLGPLPVHFVNGLDIYMTSVVHAHP